MAVARVQADGDYQRCEPAADGARIVTDVNGWPRSAPRNSSAKAVSKATQACGGASTGIVK